MSTVSPAASSSAAEADLREVAGLRSARLVLGTFPTVASSFLPLVVRRFRVLHPRSASTS